MEWTEIKIYTTAEGIEPVSAMLTDCGITGVQIEDDDELKEFVTTSSTYWDYVDEELLNKEHEDTRIKAYVSCNPYGNEMLMNIKEGLERLKNDDIGLDLGRLEMVLTDNLDDKVWLEKWKDYYKPFKVGEKIFIKPVWEENYDSEGRTVFNINPGHVFGTGLHQTTQLCMVQLEKYVNSATEIVDLGCGSGILSIISLLLGAKSAVAVDIDENAKKTAYENAALNGIGKENYTVLSGNVIDNEKLRDEIGYGKYDVAVANIIADVICAIAPTVKKELKKDGIFIASGIIKDRIEDVYAALKENGFTVVDTSVKDEWVSITSKAGVN
ncbi:MAG: 50S ribosomal protein L11 methyltransferase [Firmicutes bacterium]|nr:50S ribosomal protein L11 methyltransferase [Bacillota bacterium]